MATKAELETRVATLEEQIADLANGVARLAGSIYGEKASELMFSGVEEMVWKICTFDPGTPDEEVAGLWELEGPFQNIGTDALAQ